ncbi:hypothetical protein DSCA_09930 [Desulfosarcina alkanivorans]|uniref:Uncharacterized protein n=1 Tax=Desulfosarcina alkanivorans TaxID=571177 RepID=A0A5K7YEI4_9BACT|nr:hypothetical protein DSCA_09930 [Desulfosarcina alkanivorans]
MGMADCRPGRPEDHHSPYVLDVKISKFVVRCRLGKQDEFSLRGESGKTAYQFNREDFRPPILTTWEDGGYVDDDGWRSQIRSRFIIQVIFQCL